MRDTQGIRTSKVEGHLPCREIEGGRMDILKIGEDTPRRVRERLLGRPEGTLRISYIPGPGNVVGTYEHWIKGQHDPRVPVVTYSAMFYELIRRLGAEAQILTPHVPAEGVQSGVFRFDRIDAPKVSGRLSYQRSQSLRATQAVSMLDLFDPHVVVAASDFPFRGWRRIARNRKLILSMHNTFWPMGRPARTPSEIAKRQLLVSQTQALDDAICISPECARQISTLTAGRIPGQVAHPQIQERFSDPPRKQARRLLFLGRIERSKGVFLLLDAVRALRDRVPGMSLEFVGEGSAATELNAHIAKLGDPHVRHLARLDAAGVHSKIAQSDLMICPTTSNFGEGLAMVCIDAATHGVPTLASSVVPAVELLGDAARVFKVDDVEDLKKELLDLVLDDEGFQRHARATEALHDGLLDRSRSWGSVLARTLSKI